MIKLLKEANLYELITIYLSMLFFSGFWFYDYGLTLGILTVGGLLIHIRVTRRDLRFNKFNIFIIFSLIFIVLLSEYLSYTLLDNWQNFPLKLTIATIAYVIIAYLFSETISKSRLKRNFIICMVIISVFSLISNLIFIIRPSIITLFPTLTNSSGRDSYFLIFSMVSNLISDGVQRNQGIFWEPGAFQYFLCLAFILELSNSRHQPRRWVLILFFITLISTVSTTGIIIALLLMAYTLSRHKGKMNIIKSIIIVLLLFFGLLFLLPTLEGYWEYALVGKIQELFNYEPGTAIGSGSARMDALYYPLTEFKKSPLWGLGRSGYQKIIQDMGHRNLTFTPVNLFAIHGPLYGLIVIGGIYNFIKSIFEDKFDTVVIFSILMLSTTTEALQNDIFILTMCFIGWKEFSKKYMWDKKKSLVSVN